MEKLPPVHPGEVLLEDFMKPLGLSQYHIDAPRRKKVEAHAAQLIAQEMSLRDLRKALSLTQERIARMLHTSQDRVSRMERRTDLVGSDLSVKMSQEPI